MKDGWSEATAKSYTINASFARLFAPHRCSLLARFAHHSSVASEDDPCILLQRVTLGNSSRITSITCWSEEEGISYDLDEEDEKEGEDSEVRESEERSDELTTSAFVTKATRTRTSVHDTPPL